MGATGALVRLIPPGSPELDELLGLVRLGVRFRSQQAGRHRGPLAKHIAAQVNRASTSVSFNQLIDMLECSIGEYGNGDLVEIAAVNRDFKFIAYFCDGNRKEVTFSRLRNLLTECRKG